MRRSNRTISALDCLISVTGLIAVTAYLSDNQQTIPKTILHGPDNLRQVVPDLSPNNLVMTPIKFELPPGKLVATVPQDELSDQEFQIRVGILIGDGKIHLFIFLIASLTGTFLTIISVQSKTWSPGIGPSWTFDGEKINGYDPLWRNWKIALSTKKCVPPGGCSSTESLLSAGLAGLGGKVRSCINGDLL